MLKRSPAGLVAAAITLFMELIYITAIASQDDDPVLGIVVLFIVLIGAACVAVAIGSLRVTPRLRAALLWPASAVLLAIGLLAIFSIGLPLLVAGILAAAAALGAGRAEA